VSGPAVSPPPGPTPEEEADRKLIDAVAGRVVRMGLAVPAIFLLESTKPLSYVGSQVLVFLEPFVKSILTVASYDRFVTLLEDRRNVEKLLRRIEDLDEEAREREREARKRATESRKQEKDSKKAADEAGPRTDGRPGRTPRWRRILERVRPGRRRTGD
jgi:hypothetical protein